MTDAEKVAAFDKIQCLFWDWARYGNPLQSTMAAAVIRQVNISGPNGEDPEEA